MSRTPYVMLNVDFPLHPRLREVGIAARYAWACSIAIAGRHLSDGHVLADSVLAESGAPRSVIGQLVKAGLWHDQPGCEHERCEPPRGKGWVYIHDYLEHQTSKADVEARRATKAAAGRKGAQTRWGDSSAAAKPLPKTNWMERQRGRGPSWPEER